MARRLAKRRDGSFYLDGADGDEWQYNHNEPYGVRLIIRGQDSYQFVPVTQRDPWWLRRFDDRAMRPMRYTEGQYVEVHCANNVFWLGRVAPDPEGKDYAGTEFVYVILDGNEVKERSYKSGCRPLSLLEAMAWVAS